MTDAAFLSSALAGPERRLRLVEGDGVVEDAGPGPRDPGHQGGGHVAAVLTGEAGSPVCALKEAVHALCPVFLLDVDQGLEFAQVMGVAGAVAHALEGEVGGVIVMDEDAFEVHRQQWQARLLHNPAFSPRRVWAMALRYIYLLRGSWPRYLELAYWPTVQMILWGFITQFLATNSSYIAEAFGVLLSAVLLWDVMFRGQLGVSISFFEEMWSRNLGHLFVSPLRPYELIISLTAMSLVRTIIGIVPASLLAIVFFGFSVYGLGLSLAAFFVNLLVMGWAIGFVVSGMVLRFGLGAESLAWVAIFAVAPVSGIYYPISVLPDWLQIVARLLPSSYVFEGMRAVIREGDIRFDYMAIAAGLNVIYLIGGALIFLAFFRAARVRGLLLQMGE